MRLKWLFLVCALPLLSSAEEFPVLPYTDPAQLDVPWPRTSHYRQPWRGYIETRSGSEFLKGFGINLQIPEQSEELAIRLLAETGFATARIEIGFGELDWNEGKLARHEMFRRRLALCAKYRLRPTFLINAHHRQPCPLLSFRRTLMTDAPQGSRKVVLNEVNDLAVGLSGLSQLSGRWAAEALITEINYETREVTLSKPLPKPLPAGEVAMATLKYAPLHPVGTPEFDQTVGGWSAHVLQVCQLARECGLEDFDIELWNELTFGSHFLNINAYYDRATPKYPERQPDPLQPGGRYWELARRTVDAVKAQFPRARCIWGFSNTTFFHTPTQKLPPGMDGQSYHPYGTGTRRFDGSQSRRDRATVENFIPRYELRLPEGAAATFVQTESLMRLLNPLERVTGKPPGVGRFFHYMTEHGVLAEECGVKEDDAAWQLKALCATRAFSFWLNKGVDALHYYNAFESNPRSFGILPSNLSALAATAKFEDVATPPMRVLRNLTRAFLGSFHLQNTSPLQIEVTALGEQKKVFGGDETHPPLWHREVLALLPFQLTPDKHVVIFYVMTRDATKTVPDELYRVRLAGLSKNARTARIHDPHTGRDLPAPPERPSGGSVELVLPACEHPRLLILDR